MYSGTTLRIKSGRLMGVHQRIDRAARRQFVAAMPKGYHFPSSSEILHFEGLNGPDGIKRKRPGEDEPWHFVDPYDRSDRRLVDFIQDHLNNLTEALEGDNMQRAAFEAAWSAHAIVDGLTPAHHYPLEEKLTEMRDGAELTSRDSVRSKLILPGKSAREKIQRNWEYWGARGVMTTHFAFELGVATTLVGVRLDGVSIGQAELDLLDNGGFEHCFYDALDRVAEMKMYEEFSKTGWNRHLAGETKDVLLPVIIRAVTLAWLSAARKVNKV